MNDPILEVIDRQIAQLQVTRATYLGQGNANTQPLTQPSKATLRTGKAKRFVSDETKAKMKASQAARHATRKANAESVAATTPATPTTEHATVGEKAKAKANKVVVQPAATSAAQSIMPSQPA